MEQNPLTRAANVVSIERGRTLRAAGEAEDAITQLREAQAQATRWQMIAIALGGYAAWLSWQRSRAAR